MGYKIKDTTTKSGVLDETSLLTGKDRFLLFVERNRKAVLGGIFLVCVVIIILGTVLWLEFRNKEQALVLEGQAQRLYVDRPFDQPEKVKENVSQARELYQQILDQYPRTASAQLALYFLGNALADEGDLKGAIEAYEKFVAQYDGHDELIGLVYQRLGYAHLLNGDREKAVQAFSVVLDVPGALNKDQVLFEFAKLEEADGAIEKALSHYKNLLEQFPTSPFTSEASLRVKALTPEEEAKSEGPPSQTATTSDDSGSSSEKQEIKEKEGE